MDRRRGNKVEHVPPPSLKFGCTNTQMNQNVGDWDRPAVLNSGGNKKDSIKSTAVLASPRTQTQLFHPFIPNPMKTNQETRCGLVMHRWKSVLINSIWLCQKLRAKKNRVMKTIASCWIRTTPALNYSSIRNDKKQMSNLRLSRSERWKKTRHIHRKKEKKKKTHCKFICF